MLSPLKNISRFLGIDTAKEKYRYGIDPQFGYTSQEKIPDHWVKTTCGYCSVGCGMYLGVREGHAVAVHGDSDHPVNHGILCPKGLTEHHFIHSKDRATEPLLKIKGRLRPVHWETALNTLVDRFVRIQRNYGNQALGVLSTGQLVTEEFYALGKLVQLGFKTTNYDGNTTLCMSTAVAGYKRSFGSDGPPGCYADFEVADCIFLVGANIADNHPILWDHLRKNTSRTLIVADPRLSKTAMLADLYLPVKPRSDLTLINGIMKILIDAGKIDRIYIARHTHRFEELVSHLKKYSLDFVSEQTGLPRDLIKKVAHTYGDAKAGLIAWTMGVNHSTQGTETVNAINTLALITGNIGRPGAAPFSITGQCNAMGTREAGFTSSLPGYRKFENLQDREELARIWKVPVEEIPQERGWAYPDIIEGIVKGKIKALWILATNPFVSYPNQELLKDAISRLEFLVVQDGFHPTPTTEVADLVLPAAMWGEKEGTYTNSERRVLKVNRAVDPPGEARSDFDIFLEIAKKLGVSNALFSGWKKPRDAFEEWKTVSQGRLCDYSHMTYEAIEAQGGIQWGGERLYTNGEYPTSDRKARLWAVDGCSEPEPPNDRYPFLLNTGRTVEHWHTRTKTGRIELLEKMSPEAWVEINPEDARQLKIRQHEVVRVASQRGEIPKVAVRITSTVPSGHLFIPFHYIEACANNLTVSEFDPISREPNYKQCAVKVEKLSFAERGGF
ncbi:MAG: molybdopterin-dependent oxidoreductase [Deltaproteobacteria bacterium]|nr:molybdopterin-dependent oxidoreductase [Deltaproteobacteria bacterium]